MMHFPLRLRKGARGMFCHLGLCWLFKGLHWLSWLRRISRIELFITGTTLSSCVA